MSGIWWTAIDVRRDSHTTFYFIAQLRRRATLLIRIASLSRKLNTVKATETGSKLLIHKHVVGRRHE